MFFNHLYTKVVFPCLFFLDIHIATWLCNAIEMTGLFVIGHTTISFAYQFHMRFLCCWVEPYCGVLIKIRWRLPLIRHTYSYRRVRFFCCNRQNDSEWTLILILFTLRNRNFLYFLWLSIPHLAESSPHLFVSCYPLPEHFYHIY